MKKIEITDEKDKAPTDLKSGDRLKISTTSLTLEPGVTASSVKTYFNSCILLPTSLYLLVSFL